nr:immunoglobulin heavy chain junction region [Macaca mulatta]
CATLIVEAIAEYSEFW